MDITKQIKDIGLFAGVSSGKLSLLTAQATYKKFKPGEMVLGETDPIRSFYVVVSGQLKLYRSSAEGKEQTLGVSVCHTAVSSLPYDIGYAGGLIEEDK